MKGVRMENDNDLGIMDWLSLGIVLAGVTIIIFMEAFSYEVKFFFVF